MLKDGLILMCTGMGTVFSFLSILWGVVFCMSKLITYLNTIFPEEVASAPVKNVGNDVEIAIAVAAAKLRK